MTLFLVFRPRLRTRLLASLFALLVMPGCAESELAENLAGLKVYLYDTSGHAGMETDFTRVLSPAGSWTSFHFPDGSTVGWPFKSFSRPVEQIDRTPFFFQYKSDATPTVAGLWEVNAGFAHVAIPVHGPDFGMRPHTISMDFYWPTDAPVTEINFLPWIGDHASSPTLILWQPGLPTEILEGRKMAATFEYLPGCSLHGKVPDHVETILPGPSDSLHVAWGGAGLPLPTYLNARLDDRVCTGPVRATLSLEGYTSSTVLLNLENRRGIEMLPLLAPASPGARGPTQLFKDYGFDVAPFEPWPIDGDAFPVGHLAEYRRQQPAPNSTGWLAR